MTGATGVASTGGDGDVVVSTDGDGEVGVEKLGSSGVVGVWCTVSSANLDWKTFTSRS